MFDPSITEVEVQDLLAEIGKHWSISFCCALQQPVGAQFLSILCCAGIIDVGENPTDHRCDYTEFLHVLSRPLHSSSAADPGSGAGLLSGNNMLLSPAEVTELKALFERWDEDKDGKLSRQELEKMMQASSENLKPQEVCFTHSYIMHHLISPIRL